MGTGSAFGLVTTAQTYTIGTGTFVAGEAGLVRLDRTGHRVLWRNPQIRLTDLPILDRGRLLVGMSRLSVLDPLDGRTVGSVNQFHGIYTVGIDGRIAGIGPDEIAVIRI
jgi:hypothetical protein